MTAHSDLLVSYAPAALEDLTEISTYLQEDRGGDAASELLGDLRRACASIQEFPLRFAADASTGGHLRRCPWKSWFIYYRSDQAVEIVRILHQARNVTSDMFPAPRT